MTGQDAEKGQAAPARALSADVRVLADRLNGQDLDAWLACLLADDTRRPRLLAAWCFVHEVLAVPWKTSEPTLGLLRLEWWRERIAAPDAAATPLDRMLHRTLSPHVDVAARQALTAAIDAAAALLAAPLDEKAARAWARRWRFLPALLAGEGIVPPAPAADLAEAWGLAQLLRRDGRRRRNGLPLLAAECDRAALAARGLRALDRVRRAWRPPRRLLAALAPLAMSELWLRRERDRAAGRKDAGTSLAPPGQPRRQLWLLRRLLAGGL